MMTYIKHLVDLYDSSIFYIDHLIGELISKLKERNIFEKTLIVITSDHGEEFFEHKAIKHCNEMYNSTLHVPLIFIHPMFKHKEFTGIVRLLDIFPTLLEINKLDPDKLNIEGISLFPILKGKGQFPSDLVAFGQFLLFLQDSKQTITTIQQSYKKIIFQGSSINEGKFEFFNLIDDPREKKPITKINTDFKKHLINLMENAKKSGKIFWKNQNNNLKKMSPEIVKKLKSLGYM